MMNQKFDITKALENSLNEQAKMSQDLRDLELLTGYNFRQLLLLIKYGCVTIDLSKCANSDLSYILYKLKELQ